MAKKKTHEDFISEMYIINPNIEIVGEYINIDTKIKCRCKKDGHEWYPRPNDLLHKGGGCPKCALIKQRERQLKTHEKFILELDKINKNIEVLGEYRAARIKLLCKCKICGCQWEVLPCSLLRGHGCPKCATTKGISKITKTHKSFIRELNKKHPTIEVLGEYKTARTKITFKCTKDGFEWDATPDTILRTRNKGCPKCSGNVKNKTTDDFIKELYTISSNIIIHGEYVNSKIKVACECKACGYNWDATPSSLLAGSGCPKCNFSKGELAISKYLDDNYINYKTQYTFKGCKQKRKLPFDFYLPKLNIVIEYQGVQHYEPVEHFGGVKDFNLRKIRDDVKEKYCKQNNIRIIKIPYTTKDVGMYLDKELKINKLQLELII